MAKDDWAIVVGIARYPELGNLDGPENDAQGFYDWLVAPDGGDVPPDNIAFFLSSRFPPAIAALRAEPGLATLQVAFDELQELAKKNFKSGNGYRVGRRLYIFLSGHGCSPSSTDTALLAANANRDRPGYHIIGRLYADTFLIANFFDEAVLFMDCCRENVQTPPNIPPYNKITGPDALDKARCFYGFATKWSRLSRERKMADGLVHGVFTTALLAGLKGAACDPTDGRITSASLGSYLYANMKTFLSPADLNDPEIPQEPDLDYGKNPQTPLVFATVAIPEFPVTINLPPETAGKTIEILDSKFNVVESTTAAPPQRKTKLKRGLYLATVLTTVLRKDFEVTGGTEEVNVSF